jgi:hypothetical protein
MDQIMLNFKNDILKKMVSNGFSLDIPTESMLNVNDNIGIRYAISDCYNYFTIDFFDKKYDSGDILTLKITNIITGRKKNKPHYSIVTYDDISCFSSIKNSFTKFKVFSEMSHFSRENAIAIAEELMKNEALLVNSAKKNNLLLIEKEKQQEKKAELARLKRIADYESKYEKIGKEKAALIIENIENEVFESEESISKDFLFLKITGYEITQTISAVWERGRLSWKMKRRDLIFPEQLLEIISKSRVKRKDVI